MNFIKVGLMVLKKTTFEEFRVDFLWFLDYVKEIQKKMKKIF